MTIANERSAWDARAEDLDLAGLEREMGYVAVDRLWLWLRAELDASPPSRVLDAGCGRGATTRLLAEWGLGTVVGIDVSPGSLHCARLLSGGLERPPFLAVAPLEALPFADATFDAVVGRFVLHHAEDLDRSAAELARVLGPSGRGLFVETWNRNPLLRLGRAIAQGLRIGLGTADERPLGGREIAILERHFAVQLHFPVFTGFELLNRLFRRLAPLARRSPRVRKWVSRAWQRSIATDRWIEGHWPRARSYGWFVALELRPRR